MMLDIRHLQVRYGRRPGDRTDHRAVLRDFTPRPLQAGQLIAVLGPNGSGKTTLLKALAGQAPVSRPAVSPGMRQRAEAPDAPASFSPQVLFKAAGDAPVDLLRLNPEARARRVAYLPQSLPPAVPLRVLESLLVADWQRGRGPGGRAASFAASRQILTQLAIHDLAMRPLDTLSGGQRQLVGIAQVLVRHTPILLLDEPLSALDLRRQVQVLHLLARETRERQCLTLVVLHDLNVALQHAHACLLLQQGRLVAQGQPEAVITPATLAAVWGVDARVERCSRGIPRVWVDGPSCDKVGPPS